MSCHQHHDSVHCMLLFDFEGAMAPTRLCGQAAYLTLPACTIGTRLQCRMLMYSSIRFLCKDQTAPRLAENEMRYRTAA